MSMILKNKTDPENRYAYVFVRTCVYSPCDKLIQKPPYKMILSLTG